MQNSPFIDIHTHRPHAEERYILSYSIGIDEKPKVGEQFSTGIHPWRADKVDAAAALSYMESAPVVAIGEIGLDFIRSVDRDLQIKLFKKQLDIAERRQLPVIIHCVRAYNEVLNIIRGRDLVNVIFHSYIGSLQQTETVIERGYYISLSGMSLGSSRTVKSVRETPISRVFAETDMGDGDELSIRDVYAAIANIKELSITELRGEIWSNYKRVFK